MLDSDLDCIKGKDVDGLIRANASTLVQDLPESLFDVVPHTSWQTKACQLIEQLLVTIPAPSKYHAQLEQIAAAIATDNAQQQLLSPVEITTF